MKLAKSRHMITQLSVLSSLLFQSDPAYGLRSTKLLLPLVTQGYHFYWQKKHKTIDQRFLLFQQFFLTHL